MLDLKTTHRTGVQIELFNLCFWGFSLNQNFVKSEHDSNWEKSIVQPSVHAPIIDPSLDYLDLSLDPRLDHVNRIDHLDVGRDHIDNLSIFSSAGATSVQVLKSSNLIICPVERERLK